MSGLIIPENTGCSLTVPELCPYYPRIAVTFLERCFSIAK